MSTKIYTADSFKDTLGNDLVTSKVSVEAGKSLVLDTEISKLVILDATTDLQKPVSTLQESRIQEVVTAQIMDSILIGGVTEASSVPPTGNIHAIGVGAGNYPNWGGMIIPPNNIGTLQRVDGVYSVSLTPIELSGKVNVSDIVNEITPENISKIPTVQATINHVYRKNLYGNNKYKETVSIISSLPFNKNGFYFGFGILGIKYADAKNVFGYAGNLAEVSFSSAGNGGVVLKKNDFFTTTMGANLEIYTPVSISGTYIFNEVTPTTLDAKGTTVSFSFSAGVNVLKFPVTTFGTDYDSILLRIFPDANQWDNQIVKFGRCFLYDGINNTTGRLEEDVYTVPYIEADNILKNQQNLFVHNKYLRDLAVPNIDGLPLSTSFNFGFSIINQSFIDALPIFGYVGNCASLDFSTVSNGGLMVMKSDFENLSSYNNDIYANIEISVPNITTGELILYQGTAGSFVQKGNSIPMNLTTGVNVINVPKTTFDADYDLIWFRFFPGAGQWDSQTVKFGRIMMSSESIDGSQLSVSIQEIYANLYDDSNLIKELRADLTPFSLSHWYGKKIVILGDSITAQNLWQPEIIRAIGCTIVNRGEGGSMVTPYITGLTGQTAGLSMYFRADAIDTDSPDLILLYGGQNDNLTTMGGDILLGSIADAPYTGAEVSSSPPSFYASYKGTVVKLITQNPTTPIKLIAPLYSGDQSYAIKKSKCDAVTEIGKLYGLEVFNLLENIPVNAINLSNLAPDTVHPNQTLGTMMGVWISNKLR